jgi:hypothetical protein
MTRWPDPRAPGTRRPPARGRPRRGEVADTPPDIPVGCLRRVARRRAGPGGAHVRRAARAGRRPAQRQRAEAAARLGADPLRISRPPALGIQSATLRIPLGGLARRGRALETRPLRQGRRIPGTRRRPLPRRHPPRRPRPGLPAARTRTAVGSAWRPARDSENIIPVAPADVAAVRGATATRTRNAGGLGAASWPCWPRAAAT